VRVNGTDMCIGDCLATSVICKGKGELKFALERHAPGCFISGKDPVPLYRKAGWAPGPVWTGAENLASPDHPVRRESLHRLSYRGPLHLMQTGAGVA
jgi:hypothetical protein